jgi:hypothetical protein
MNSHSLMASIIPSITVHILNITVRTHFALIITASVKPYHRPNIKKSLRTNFTFIIVASIK